MDGAVAPALFSGSRETVWAALPARPAALRRNPASRVFHFVAALQVRLITAGLLVAFCRPPRLTWRSQCQRLLVIAVSFQKYIQGPSLLITAWQFLPVQPHMRSPFAMAAPSPRIRRVRLREDGTILSGGILSHAGWRFAYPGSTGLRQPRLIG